MKSDKFKIGLFMLPPLTQGGGAEKYFIELARNLRKRGFETDVVTMDERFFRKFARVLHIFTRGNFFRKIDTSGRESGESVSRRLREARWIKANFRNLREILKNYDVIYSKNELADLTLLKAKGYEKIPPIIVGVHTPIFYPEKKSFASKLHNFLYSSLLYRWLLEGTKCIHVSNKTTKDIVEKYFNIESKLIYYPFSARAIAGLTGEKISEIGFDADKKNVIFVGRLGEQKGVGILANIIEKTSEDTNLREKLCINIFGSGDKEYETRMTDLAEKHLFVRYFGHIENKFIPHILSQQDLMVAPSKWETLPYSILEAQALGVPVVAFNIPGPNDIIENGKTGFLVGSEKEFFEKMKDIIEKKIIFDKKSIIQNIENKFSPPKIYAELINMFQEIL